MEVITPPTEIVSQAMINVLKKAQELNPEKFNKNIKGYKKRIRIDTDLYPVFLEFDDGKISVKYSETPEAEDYDFGISFDFETLVDIAEGKVSGIIAFFKGRIKISSIWKLFSVLKLYQLIMPPITSKKGELHDP
ncbi:MAG: hypothetical protein GF329_10400 [Candidatus Lokiarchaeota archaeon]|nr:hypothetical protein [Candidatus Lokiarchaeota archaeon]